MNTILHRNLRSLRLIRGLSQQYMAKELGISQRAYSKLENGQTAMTLDRVTKICLILEYNHNHLLSLKIDVNLSDLSENPDEKENIDESKQFPEERFSALEKEIEKIKQTLSEIKGDR